MNEELLIALSNYEKKFDDGFPMFPMSAESPERIIDIINECIEKNSDVYVLGYLSEDTIY